VLLTLIPIVGGVILASMTEATFNWGGFLSAMFSNITFQSRNVLSKKLMISKGSLDNMNLFQVGGPGGGGVGVGVGWGWGWGGGLSKKLMISKGSLDNMKLFQVWGRGGRGGVWGGGRQGARGLVLPCSHTSDERPHPQAPAQPKPTLTPPPTPPTHTPTPQIITIMAFFMLMPVQLLIEGGPFLPHRFAELVRGACGVGSGRAAALPRARPPHTLRAPFSGPAWPSR
jgi:hypothetical protein